jgi:arylsulfatase
MLNRIVCALTLTLLWITALAYPTLVLAQSQSDETRPNIIFLITDDQGYGDISAHGNPVLKTPHLDKLYSESMRFTDFHVSPTCSPTRSALMTGRHEFKNGVTHTILERERLTLKATTIAQLLQDSGYTTGIFGKWHLGDEAEYQPNRRGFDEVFIHGGGGIGQTYPGSCGDAPGNEYFDPTILHNGVFEKTKGYCTDIFYKSAINWIDTQRKKEKPFFCYIPTNAPHAPYIARPEDKALYQEKGLAKDTESFFGMIHNIDQNIGQLLAKLDQWNLSSNTLVVFMNDNGGTAGVKVFNVGMRGAKGTAWLGGTRASSFWRWPNKIKPGDCAALAAHIDFFPTIAEVAGLKIPQDTQRQVEGRSLVPLLKNPASPWEDRYLFTHLGRWPKWADPNDSKFAMTSIRNSRWSLISPNGTKEPKWQLFDLSKDYSQQNDVKEQHPEVVREMSAEYDRWWSDCLPLMVNEKVLGPSINPFHAIYYKQFGGSPSEKDLERMKPTPPPSNTPDTKPKPQIQKQSLAPPNAPEGKLYVYKQSAGKPRSMEIYFPPNHDPKTARVPGVLMFHGGGWSGGNLSQFRALCHYLAQRGLVTATANYRMLSNEEVRQLPAGETRKRVCITDAKSALRWFKQHAEELGVDSNKIITGGGSAGGHIALLATSNPELNDPNDPANINTDVIAYLLFNPALALDDHKDMQIDAMKQVRSTLPPALVVFGDKDAWKEGWDNLHRQLISQGNQTTELWIAKGEGHGFFNRDPWLTVTITAADRFLTRKGLLTGEPTLSLPSSGEQLTGPQKP